MRVWKLGYGGWTPHLRKDAKHVILLDVPDLDGAPRADPTRSARTCPFAWFSFVTGLAQGRHSTIVLLACNTLELGIRPSDAPGQLPTPQFQGDGLQRGASIGVVR
eukprot:237825-Rhodomonas_salina.1